MIAQDVLAGASQAILRVRIGDRKIERVATFEQIPRADVLAASHSPMLAWCFYREMRRVNAAVP